MPKNRMAGGPERAFAGEHLVEHAAEAEQIAARVKRLPLQLLRRHVRQRPGIAGGAFSAKPRNAEVQQFDSQPRDQDIGWLQVMMNDSF